MSSKDRPTIFVVNDDGIFAPGIRTLISIVRKLGKVVVVAPDSPQSGTGHAITTRHPLRLRKITVEEDYEEYSCNGTWLTVPRSSAMTTDASPFHSEIETVCGASTSP